MLPYFYHVHSSLERQYGEVALYGHIKIFKRATIFTKYAVFKVSSTYAYILA